MCVLFFACFISGKKLFIRFSYSHPNGEGCPVFLPLHSLKDCPPKLNRNQKQAGRPLPPREAETASGKYFDIGQTTSHQQFIAHGSVGSLHTVSRSLAIVKRFCVCYFPPVLLLSRKRKCAFCLVYFVCVCVCTCGWCRLRLIEWRGWKLFSILNCRFHRAGVKK